MRRTDKIEASIVACFTFLQNLLTRLAFLLLKRIASFFIKNTQIDLNTKAIVEDEQYKLELACVLQNFFYQLAENNYLMVHLINQGLGPYWENIGPRS